MSTNTYPHKTINGVKKPIHRHIMEDHLGRLLRENEHVYHINGDPKDNSLENLIVIVKNIRRKKEKNEAPKIALGRHDFPISYKSTYDQNK